MDDAVDALSLADAVGCELDGAGAGRAASRSGVGATGAEAADVDGSTAAGAADAAFELSLAAAGTGAVGAGAGMTAATRIDASVAAAFDAAAEPSLLSLLSLSPSSLLPFVGALADCFAAAGVSDDGSLLEVSEDAVGPPLCDEFAELELAWFCVGWFFAAGGEAGCAAACGCCCAGGGELCALELLDALDDGDGAGAAGAGVGPLPTLDCRTLEKLCIGALPPLADEEAGAAGAAPIMSRIESVIYRAAYAQAR